MFSDYSLKYIGVALLTLIASLRKIASVDADRYNFFMHDTKMYGKQQRAIIILLRSTFNSVHFRLI